MIHYITTDDLKQMVDIDGLVLLGCGGDPGEWLEGINKTLNEAGILLNNNEFVDISVFERDELTNILFDFNDIEPGNIDISKLAIWRLQSRETFGAMWLSDYLTNELGVDIEASKHSEANVTDSEPKAGEPSTDETEKDEAPSRPFSVYLENVHNTNIGGFTIPLPTTIEELQPFLDDTEITGWQDIKIVEVESDIRNLDEIINDTINKTMSADALDELNYLAARIQGMSESGMDIFCGNIEAKKNCKSVAELINLTFDDNLNCFDVLPAFNAEMYGESLVEYMLMDQHADAFNRLNNSNNQDDRDFAAHITKLEKNVDAAAFGRATAKEENGVFTDYGLLIGGDGLQVIYRDTQDIPVEHRIFTEQGEVINPVIKIADVSIAEAIVKLHAVGCRSMEFATHNLKILASVLEPSHEGHRPDNYLSNNYLLVLNHSDISLTPVMEAYKRGSDATKYILTMAEMAARQSDIKIFALCINDVGDDAVRGVRDLKGDLIELNTKALHANIIHNAATPDRVDAIHDDGTKKSYDLFAWSELLQNQRYGSAGLYTFHYPDRSLLDSAGHYSSLMAIHEMSSHVDSFAAHLPQISTVHIADGENSTLDLIRIASDAAKEILARGDADVYKITGNGAVKLSFIEAARPMRFAEYRDVAIKRSDAAGLDKWAERKVDSIMRQVERDERNKSKHKGEDL